MVTDLWLTDVVLTDFKLLAIRVLGALAPATALLLNHTADIIGALAEAVDILRGVSDVVVMSC